MKALLFITGRGMGGDAINALNIARSLESCGVQCELVLDPAAPGLVFKRHGYTWHKSSIPQAGGSAFTKANAIKAGFKAIKAVFAAVKLINKTKADMVVGIIGGGAVIGCVAAKLARVPAVGMIDTPLDTKVCTKLNKCIVLPEAQLFKEKILPENVEKSFFPLTPGLTQGDKYNGLAKIKEHLDNLKSENPDAVLPEFDENKKTILFSSGSSLFELTAKGLANFTKVTDDYNIVLIGTPLEEEYLNYVDESKVINVGYITWIRDLYACTDLAVLTDDGVMIQEAIACELPSVALTRVKYGRYHNMESIFPGAVIEADFDELNDKIFYALDNLDEIQTKTSYYNKEVLVAGEKIANIVLSEGKK